MKPWDYTNLILNKSRRLTVDELKEYPMYMINKIFSCDSDLCFFVQELNKYDITPQMHYDFLYYLIPKTSRYIPYSAKKTKDDEEVRCISEHYQVNSHLAKSYHELLLPEDITRITTLYKKGTI